jgi:hypothetical protein
MRQIAPFELGLHQVQNAESKDCGLPRACFGLVNDVVTLNDRWDGLDLDGARVLEAHFLEAVEELRLEEEVFPEDVVGEEGGVGGLQVHEPVDKNSQL